MFTHPLCTHNMVHLETIAVINYSQTRVLFHMHAVAHTYCNAENLAPKLFYYVQQFDQTLSPKTPHFLYQNGGGWGVLGVFISPSQTLV